MAVGFGSWPYIVLIAGKQQIAAVRAIVTPSVQAFAESMYSSDIWILSGVTTDLKNRMGSEEDASKRVSWLYFSDAGSVSPGLARNRSL